MTQRKWFGLGGLVVGAVTIAGLSLYRTLDLIEPVSRDPLPDRVIEEPQARVRPVSFPANEGSDYPGSQPSVAAVIDGTPVSSRVASSKETLASVQNYPHSDADFDVKSSLQSNRRYPFDLPPLKAGRGCDVRDLADIEEWLIAHGDDVVSLIPTMPMTDWNLYISVDERIYQLAANWTGSMDEPLFELEVIPAENDTGPLPQALTFSRGQYFNQEAFAPALSGLLEALGPNVELGRRRVLVSDITGHASDGSVELVDGLVVAAARRGVECTLTNGHLDCRCHR